METTFNLLKNQKKNTLDGLIQWLKDTKIIDGEKLTEEKARSCFDGMDPNNIELDKLDQVLNKMAEHVKEIPEELKKKFIGDADAIKLLEHHHGFDLSGFKNKIEDMSKQTTAKVTGLAEKAEAATSQAIGQAANLATSAADDITGLFDKNKKKAADLAKSVKDNLNK